MPQQEHVALESVRRPDTPPNGGLGPANRNYPTPDEARVARRLESVIAWLQIEVDDLERQARALGAATPRQQLITADLQRAIIGAQTAQRLLRHEGD